MDRTVPKTASEDIALYMRTYYSLLRSTDTIQIETLVESHKAMSSSLHVGVRKAEPDISALIYSSMRLPMCMADVEQIIIGQMEKGFADAGWTGVSSWRRVYSPARRRRIHFDDDHTLAVFIASRSDIDDLVPIVTAYQIEWNKVHYLLRDEIQKGFLRRDGDVMTPLTASEFLKLSQILRVSIEDLQRLERAWKEQFLPILLKMGQQAKQMGLRLISGSLADYRRATAVWWRDIVQEVAPHMDVDQYPVYFVSSNTHVLPNLLTGFALRRENDLISYIREKGHEDLLTEYETIQRGGGQHKLNNFLYYVLKKYLSDADVAVQAKQSQEEMDSGIYRVSNEHGFEIEAQVISIKDLNYQWMDQRLLDDFEDAQLLAQSNALILNIDYPLGLAAYELLNRVTENVRLLGVYVMGKAATLNGRVNDLMIPNVVHDEHSQNTYMFNNCFTAHDVNPFVTYSSVLDNQKAISVPGTFLQNPTYMDVFYKEGFTDIEMEAGPYLSSIYEAFRPKRHPFNEIVNLYSVPFDIGLIHYASDTPMSKGHNLGSNMSYAGIDPTYAAATAILRRIFAHETQRLRSNQTMKTIHMQS